MPEAACCIEEHTDPIKVGLDSSIRVQDGAVVVALGCKVQDDIDILSRRIHSFAVLYLAMNEDQTVIPFELLQVLKVPRIGQCVKDGYFFGQFLAEHHPDVIGADKPGAARD